ncbi:unnamed protein product [Effrenium voratum]|uniref:Uncharacterized protein n=1 Tax=Effrenium voratum TaxID=2562239 RepID=A0AA36NHI0_9DINO|nr:unnamed protein product [Effrenium voratum]
MPKLAESQSAPLLRPDSLPRLHSSTFPLNIAGLDRCELQGSERVGKAEEYMYLQVKRCHWPQLSPDCKLWTLRDFALQHSNWDSFTDKGKLRVIYELGSLLCESGDKLKEDAMLKARNDLQLAVTEARQLPRVVRSDKLRATAVAGLCEGLNLPSAARRLKEALGAAKHEEFEVGHIQNLAKKFRFRGYIEKIEDRSLTIGQLRKVLKFCQEACHHWSEGREEVSTDKALTMDVLNLYHIDHWLIWPATEASRSSFVELLADQEQRAQWCVSHCWSQPHASFVECIGQHVKTRGLHRRTNFWIWAYAHRHYCSSLEAPESGFYQSLEAAESRLLLVLQDVNSAGEVAGSMPFDRLWCMFEVMHSLDSSSGKGMARAPLDVAVFNGSKAAILTYGLTDAEEAMDCRFPGSGAAAKAAREQDFPVSVVAGSLQQRVETAQSEDAAYLLERMAAEVDGVPDYNAINARLSGFFALVFLRKIFEDRPESEELAELKDLAARALAQDAERVEIDITLGGCGFAVDESLLLLVKHMAPRLQRITLDLKGSSLKNASLAEVANFLSPDVQDILLDLQGCRTVTDTGLKRFMENLMDCDRSKLSTVSCLLMGRLRVPSASRIGSREVVESCQEACEILDLEQIQQVRRDLELQERKNQIKRLMKNVLQGKAAIASFRKLLQSNVEVAVRGILGEQGSVDACHVEWDISSKEMPLTFDKAFLRVLLDVGATIEFMKRSEAPPYSVLWPHEGPDRDPESLTYKVNHRHQAFADSFAQKLPEVQKTGRKAVAAGLVEARAGDLIVATVPKSVAARLAFIYAAREGNTEAVAAILREKGSDLLAQVDEATWDEEDLLHCEVKLDAAPHGTALHGAAQYGHSEVVQKLIDWGADVNQLQFGTDATALTLAAQKGWLEVASILLENGADIEARDMTGRTALSWAAEMGHLHVVEELLEREAHIDLPDRKGMTPLMYTAGIGQVAVAQKLIEAGANIKAVDKEEKTAALHATIYDTDKMGLQQKKQKILDMIQLREKELEREAEREAERALELEREAVEEESEVEMTP